jgi:hypothetical protein
MWFWHKIVFLLRKLQTMVDEQFSLGLTPSTSQNSAESNGTEPLDPDLRPGIGRCYPEAREVERLIKELRSIHAALGNAVAKLGDCRANAQAPGAAADAAVTGALIGALANVIDGFDEDMNALTSCPACKQPAETKAE